MTVCPASLFDLWKGQLALGTLKRYLLILKRLIFESRVRAGSPSFVAAFRERLLLAGLTFASRKELLIESCVIKCLTSARSLVEQDLDSMTERRLIGFLPDAGGTVMFDPVCYI